MDKIKLTPDRLAYSIPELCEAAGNIGRSTIYREIASGKLVAHRLRGRTIVLVANAESWLDSLPLYDGGQQ